LVVFLALMLFHAALTIDVRELIDDAAPRGSPRPTAYES
jgi:hypothetical protein